MLGKVAFAMRRSTRFGLLSFVAAIAPLAACGSSAGVPVDDAPFRDAGVESATGPSPEAGVEADAGVMPNADASTDASFPSRCTVTDSSVYCSHEVTPLEAGGVTRDVYWQTPSTPAPAGGYPVVLLYQGSLGGPSLTWDTLTPNVPFGGFHQGRLQAMLLEHGFTVIAPAAAAGVAWQTNSGVPYDLTTDKQVIDALLVAVENGEFGPADMSRLYATGISSGGYMTSRMAVSYAGKFRALAIQSASYVTCLGAVCYVPNKLPADHPPTLFLHGALDTTVPLFTAERYYDELVADGVATKKIVDPSAGHAWLAVSPAEITDWFTKH